MSTGGLFKPSRPDGRADWRVVYDVLIKMDPGQTITHEDLMEALETEDRSRLYRAVGRADRELWLSSRAVGNVKGVGYRILVATEHEPRANNHKRQARRRMSKAVAVIDATDLNQLDAEQRNWVAQVQQGFHILAAAMDAHERRISKHDAAIESLQERVQQLENK